MSIKETPRGVTITFTISEFLLSLVAMIGGFGILYFILTLGGVQ